MLGPAMTEPIGSRDLAVFRLVDMFTACTTPDVKEAILNAFSDVKGKLRVVVATIAFGMQVFVIHQGNKYCMGCHLWTSSEKLPSLQQQCALRRPAKRTPHML